MKKNRSKIKSKNLFKNIIKAYIIIFTILFFIACNGWCQELVGQAKEKDKIIVRIGESAINAVNLNEYLSYRPLSSNSSITLEAIELRLDEMIMSEALYQEALRKGIHQDPKIQRIIHQILIRKLLEDEVEQKVLTRAIKEEELQTYYEKYKYEFNRPEQVRFADIFIALDSESPLEQRNEKKRKAESILAEVLKDGKRRSRFGELIIKHSDRHPKYPLGDTGFIDAEGKPLWLDVNLTNEAFKLKNIGDICDHVIETGEGYHIIMLIEKRSAFYNPLDKVKDEIENRIRHMELERTRDAYIKKIMEKTEIQKNEEAIAEMVEMIKDEAKKGYLGKMDKFKSQPMDFHAPLPFPGQDN